MLKPFDISLSQYCLLRILRHNYPLPTQTMSLRYAMIDKVSDVTRLINRLQVRDLLTKKVNPDDKRISEVFITEKGQNLLKFIEAELGDKPFLEHIDDEKIEILLNILRDMMPSDKQSAEATISEM